MVKAEALLFTGFGSPAAEATAAVFVMPVPGNIPGSTTTTRVKRSEPTAKDGLPQETVPPAPTAGVVQVQPPGAARETKVVSAGRVSIERRRGRGVRPVVGNGDRVGEVGAGVHRIGRIDLGDGEIGDREDADEHRIVVRGAVGRRRLEENARRHQRGAVRLLFERRFAGVLDLVVVVEEARLVGVDVPGADAGDLRCQAGAREGVVEVAELAVEQVGVGGGAEQRGLEVGVAAAGRAW